MGDSHDQEDITGRFDLSDAVPLVTGEEETAPTSTPERVEPETVAVIRRDIDSIELERLIDDAVQQEVDSTYAALVAFWPDHKGHDANVRSQDVTEVVLRCANCELELHIPIVKYELWFATQLGLAGEEDDKERGQNEGIRKD